VFPTWNETAGFQVSHVQSHSSPPLGPWCYKEKMATPEQKEFCMLQFANHESVVSVQQAFRRQFQSDPHLPTASVSDNGVPLYRENCFTPVPCLVCS
jgi:hypothetical protein